MKEILTKIWSFSKRYMGYIFLGIILIIMFSLTLQKCNDTTELIDEIDLNKYRRELLDSIAKVNHAKTIAVIDSLNAFRESQIRDKDKTIQSITKEISLLKSELNELKSNPIEDISECLKVIDIQDSIIVRQEDIIKEQNEVIVIQRETISELTRKFELEQKEKERVYGMYYDCTKENDRLIKALEKKDTWWNKNEKWVYAGMAVVGTVLIIK